MTATDAAALPEYLQTVLTWSDSYWYSALRIVAIIGGTGIGLGILFGVLLPDWPSLLRNPIAGASILLGPFAPILLAQTAPLSECQTWSIAVGRKLVPIDCGPGHSTEPALLAVMEESRAQLENNDLYNFMEMVQGHWLFQAITLVILAIVAREAVLELYRWIKTRWPDGRER